MKTIDTKSLLLGSALSIMFFMLTSSKVSTDNSDDLEIFTTIHGHVEVFNKQTKTIYEYRTTSANGQIKDNAPNNIYKVEADGSRILISK